MDFTSLSFFKIVWYLILLITFTVIMKWLVGSAASSLRSVPSTAKGFSKWKVILDELLIGIVVVVIFLIVANIPFATIFNFFKPIVVWIFGLILEPLRLIGIPV